MMNRILLAVVLFLPFRVFGQSDWSPLYEGQRLNYKPIGGTVIKHVIFATDVSADAGETIYSLNRVMRPCDTCQAVIDTFLTVNEWIPDMGNMPSLWKTECGQFLGKKAMRTDSNDWAFYENELLFILKPALGLGAEWQANPDGNLMAIVIAAGESDFFGQTDSVKTILFSDGREFEVSKTLGITRYADDQTVFELVGIDGPDVGERLPGPIEFFSFSAGDVFEYQDSWGYVTGPFGTGFTSCTKLTTHEILTASITETQAVYTGWKFATQTCTEYSNNQVTITQEPGESFSWTFDLTGPKRYPGEALWSVSSSFDIPFVSGMAEFTLIEGRYVLSRGLTFNHGILGEQQPFFYLTNELHTPLDGPYAWAFVNSQAAVLSMSEGLASNFNMSGYSRAAGLGTLSTRSESHWYGTNPDGSWGGGSSSNKTFLRGAIVSGELFGIMPSVAERLAQGREWIVFPNPTEREIRISGIGPGDYEAVLFDSRGVQISLQHIRGGHPVLSVAHLPAGIYVLRLMDDNGDVRSFRVVKY
jgi:hypothetical protein